jgi:SulP family sulfate permease
MVITFLATLVLPVQNAVFVGVLLSVAVYFLTSAHDVRLMELVPNPDGTYREQPAPKELPSDSVTMVHIYGSVFFAGAVRVQELLPSAKNAERAVVILRLRQHSQISSTFINVLERYEAELGAKGGKLMLAGVGEHVKEQLDRTETTSELLGEKNIFLATDTLGASMQSALAAAQRWLEKPSPEPDTGE